MISGFPPQTIRQHVYNPYGSRAVDGLSPVDVDRKQSVYNSYGSRRVDMLTLLFRVNIKNNFFHVHKALREAL
jgi:hypothetical protein